MLPNKIFYEWVHVRLHLLLLILLLIPLSIANGVVGSASVYMVGSLSAIPADITMASYAFTIGLVTGIPLVLWLKEEFTSKVILMGVFGGLIITNFVLGHTDEPLILVMTSFVAGFIKIIGLLEVLATLIPILMPKGERYRLYAVYYPVNLISAQLITIIFVALANTYNWQLGQLFLNVPLFLGLLIAIVLVHPHYPEKRLPAFEFDWPGLVLSMICMLLLSYILTYGQVKDWFASSEIMISTVFCLLSLILVISRTFVVERPFLDLHVFEYKNVVFGLIIMFVLGLFYAASNLQTAMISIILKSDQIEATRVNLYMIPGFAAATLIGYFYYRKFNGFKTIIVIVAVCYTISFIQLYFLTTPQATSQDFYLPMFFRGTAILLSYMAIGIYIADGIPFIQFFSVIFYYLTIRTFLGPVIWSSFLSNLFYRRTIHNINLLASKADLASTYQQERYLPAYKSALVHGFSSDQAADLATRGIYNSIQTQASLLALKECFGVIIIIGLLFITGLILIRIYQFKGTEHEKGFVLP